MHCKHCGEVILPEHRPGVGVIYAHLNGHRMCAPTFATPDPHHV